MDAVTERPKFATSELMYFEKPAVQTFFSKWCEINDSITPQFIDRTNWINKGFLQPNNQGGKTLYLPKDLQLWEMVDVIEEVDKDTYGADSVLPNSKKEKLQQLGEMFKSSGIYIAQRVADINHGRDLAEHMAVDFYNYGCALLTGENSNSANFAEITKIELTPQQVDEVDHWLAGDRLYASRRAKAEELILNHPEKKDEILESQRQKTLAQFFELSKRRPFFDKIQNQIQKAAETPKHELVNTIFRRGLEHLVKEMRANLLVGRSGMILQMLSGLSEEDFIARQEKLYHVLNIPVLKRELEEVRKTGDVKKIGGKELLIASNIQSHISNLPYEKYGHSPSEMIAKGYLNCVGASTLGGGLLSELGIRYLVGFVPEHSILVLATSDQRVIWMDMLSSDSNEELTDNMLRKDAEDGKKLTIRDVWQFSDHPTEDGLNVHLEPEKFRSKVPHAKQWQSTSVRLLSSEKGHLAQLLGNTTDTLYRAGMEEEALECSKLAAVTDPYNAGLYVYQGGVLVSLKRFDEAIITLRKAISLDQGNYDAYESLGKALVKGNRTAEAIEVLEKALEINPRGVDAHEELGAIFINQGRMNEALNLYHDLIQIDPDNILANLRLGGIYYCLEQNDEAVSYLNKTINLADKDSKVEQDLAKIAKDIIATLN